MLNDALPKLQFFFLAPARNNLNQLNEETYIYKLYTIYNCTLRFHCHNYPDGMKDNTAVYMLILMMVKCWIISFALYFRTEHRSSRKVGLSELIGIETLFLFDWC